MEAHGKKLTLAHSPDSDDAFMFWALVKGHVRADGIEFEHVLSDIQSLNQAALEGVYDVTAISVHTYPFVAEKYVFLNVGASVGEGYGPMLVAREPHTPESLTGSRVAIPGSLTTAALALRLAAPEVQTVELPFDRILEAVKTEDVEAGLIIHEGQITYERERLELVLDLGRWWLDETGLPLPLGANVARKALGEDLVGRVAGAIAESIAYGMSHRREAVSYAQDFGRNLEQDEVDRFVAMYVNDFTLDLGETGREAVRELLRRAADAGIVPDVGAVEFAQ